MSNTDTDTHPMDGRRLYRSSAMIVRIGRTRIKYHCLLLLRTSSNNIIKTSDIEQNNNNNNNKVRFEAMLDDK
jgi:hypothetical protein